MELKWIKMDTSLFGTNRAIRQIEGMEDGDTLLVIWFKLLLLAGRTADGGRIELIPGVPTTVEMLAVELARPLATVERALSVFSAFGMFARRQMRIVDFTASQSGGRAETKEEARAASAPREEKREKEQRGDRAARAALIAEESPETDALPPVIPAPDEDGDGDEADTLTVEPLTPEIEDEDARAKRLLALHEKEQKKRTYLGGTLGKGVLFLSPAQLDDLVERLSLEELEKYTGIVTECEQNGKHYKKRTHYDAILAMAEADRKVRS